MKILCHAGPWSDAYLNCVSHGIDSNVICIIASAHKTVDQTGFSKRYYDFLHINKLKNYTASAKDKDLILRCRLLRSLPSPQALLHLNSMRDAINEMFDVQRPDLVLSETIDAYVMDLIYEECLQRDIPFIGLVNVFVNGYVRLSARGEYNKVREPDTEEIFNVLNMLESKQYLPAFVSKSKTKPKISVFLRWSRNILKPLYFFILRYLTDEKYNYHYWASLLVASDWLHLWPRFNFGMDDWKERLSNNNKPTIYIPLQMVPEATIDYWCQSVDVIDYEKTLLNIIDKHKDSFHFLIKEHPNVLGYRNPRLYKFLMQRNNLTVCPTNFPSNELISYYDAVLVWTGTVGFECALRSKPVITLATPYYVCGDGYLLIDINTSADIIYSFIKQHNKKLSIDQKASMVHHLLSGVIPGVLKVDGSWDKNNSNDREQALKLGGALKEYLLNYTRAFN